ncbi:class I SAM-dependent methyltransferase [Lysinibacillus pakistanensis]|uniref:Class I SAM-dependent methyltransferase n=1 Tax=Lysinibacillus pakistanensis TaxID=759811 RepID=A0AAX3X4M3_9BACI|nr:class I SAM-dependent methyltransferase [Lysinibacillus pakistanensis]MDM5233313.1 class I SAM-dependent methyltransferase [Lysinibacillus pakistanensis]WHY48789.1 class I SAM-dependent methyltransferase [Lysinibacillus pakistanensis]WHY53801.1 class I SAM-dependent methyltransferase [Lysinibacillus pakistanensis]
MALLQRLIEQAKKPNGFVGSVMLRIMNVAHSGMNTWLIKHGDVYDGDIVLDIGCGGGKTLQTLSKMNPAGKIYGIDFSEQAVKDSIKTNKMDVANGKVIVKQASVSNIPYTDQFFDTITAFQTHYFWPDLANDVKEVFRVLKHGGKFIIMSELYKIHYHMKAYKTTSEIEQLFESVGFQKIQIIQNARKGCLCIIGMK